MTSNQIAYWNYAETARSNKAKERETGRTNRVNEAIKWHTLGETTRHNVAGEKETLRHNAASEALGSAQLQETNRSNLAREAETNRSNVASLAEVARHNIANEAISGYQATSGRLQAQASQSQAATAAQKVALEKERNPYDIEYTIARTGNTNKGTELVETQVRIADTASSQKDRELDIKQQEADTHSQSVWLNGFTNVVRGAIDLVGISMGKH